MATRKQSRNSARSNSSRNSHDVDQAQLQQAAQQGSQQQMVMAADTTSAVLRGAELWSELQLHALQRSGQTWREVAEKLRTAQGPLDLVAAQNHLVMNSFVQAMQLGQELLQATLLAQPGLVQPAQRQAATATESMGPMMQAWQTMMNPMGLNGAAATAQQ